ncbi:MAG: asparagine synthase-related protein, partial [Crocinitomicaceae bacterium]
YSRSGGFQGISFAIPIAEWLQKELRHLVEEFCSESRLKEHRLFDVDQIQSLLKDFFGGKKEYDMKVWYLLMFQMWYDKWMRA